VIRVPAIAMVALLAAGCFSKVGGVEEVNPEDYADWYSVTVVGEAPGHGDSSRVMYANDDAGDWIGERDYPIGSILVKEIYRRDGDSMGAFRYVAIMRKLAEAPSGGELDNGWLFTYKDALDGGTETHRPRCWRTCHQNAPFEGTFLDWSDPTEDPPPDAGADAS
jgi:hypothetical protein